MKQMTKKQTNLDGTVQILPGAQASSRDDILKTVTKFVVCDDQSLLVVDKSAFRNCLVAMRPAATRADLPSTHDISIFIHNTFVSFINNLKSEIQVMIKFNHSAALSLNH
ncbi:hypothetical protein PAXRUDRAFT_140369 [Paxillus rubicundulus Ve08.2h10]|uniref:Uncharacterized protein n=1 Tax=Paxillus rubicundulus Ve08.2h10 TaxID=930991 RepID=A0A0D0DDX0_9AGAM|nr:hypothetical protein PAXRUDRAFT_140369 [Paxillus rubicundulus Ve08.2h10]